MCIFAGALHGVAPEYVYLLPKPGLNTPNASITPGTVQLLCYSFQSLSDIREVSPFSAAGLLCEILRFEGTGGLRFRVY